MKHTARTPLGIPHSRWAYLYTPALLALLITLALSAVSLANDANDTPTDVQAISTTEGADVSWNNVSGNATYSVRFRTMGMSWMTQNCTQFAPCATADGRTTFSLNVQNSTAMEYAFQVRATTNGAPGSWVSDTPVTAMAPVSPPAAPTGVTVNATATGFAVRWRQSDGADNYKVRYARNGGTWTEVDCAANTTCRHNKSRIILRVANLGETDPRPYQVQVMAYGLDGTETDWVDTTVEAPLRTAAPTGVTARGREHMAIVRFNRIDNDNGVNYYVRVQINGLTTSISCNNGNSFHCQPTGNPNIIRATVRASRPELDNSTSL